MGHATIKSAMLATVNRKAMINDAENTSDAIFPMEKVLPQRAAVKNNASLAIVFCFMIYVLKPSRIYTCISISIFSNSVIILLPLTNDKHIFLFQMPHTSLDMLLYL